MGPGSSRGESGVPSPRSTPSPPSPHALAETPGGDSSASVGAARTEEPRRPGPALFGEGLDAREGGRDAMAEFFGERRLAPEDLVDEELGEGRGAVWRLPALDQPGPAGVGGLELECPDGGVLDEIGRASCRERRR